jgi:hypothetical protein
MGKPEENLEPLDLDRMKAIIDQLEQLLIALEEIGGEMPFIEKNVRAMMSFIHVLKFGFPDMSEAVKTDSITKLDGCE